MIPCGHVTIIEGDPGVSKSTLTIALASHVSKGLVWPDNTPCERGHVCILNAEDLRDEVIRARVEVAGCDMDAVSILSRDDSKPNESPFTLPDHLAQFEEGVKGLNVKLVVIDPFDSFLSPTIDAYRSTHIRRAMLFVEAMAQRLQCAVIILRHLSKSPGLRAKYRGLGSISLIGAARSGFTVGKDPADPSRNIMSLVKANWAPDVGGWAFRTEGVRFKNAYGEAVESSRTVWLTKVSITADDLVAGAEIAEELGSMEHAAKFVKEELASGPLKSTVLFAHAATAGISRKLLWKVSDNLGIQHRKADDGWVWELSGTTTTEDELLANWGMEGLDEDAKIG